MKRKSDIVREAVAAGNFKEALRIAKGFRINITAEQRDTMCRAYECIVHPDFYRQLGTDIPTAINAGVEIVTQIYGYPDDGETDEADLNQKRIDEIESDPSWRAIY